MEQSKERIAKRIARAGVCSRREAEKLITAGRVEVDGQTITSPALNVTPEQQVRIDGEPLPRQEGIRMWRYYKPVGLVTSHKDEQSRPTVFDALPQALPRVISVGRLDLNTEGLLLLTNDGTLARHLELPATGWTRRYRARVRGKPTPRQLEELARGMKVEGIQYGPVNVTVDRVQGANSWVSVSLKEGKNREIRNLFAALEIQVSRLIRVAYGSFQLGNLAPGELEEVPEKMLGEQLGKNFSLR